MWKRNKAVNTESSAQEINFATIVANHDTSSSREKSFLGKSFNFKGEMTGDEDLMLQGKIEGIISLKNNILTIGKNAHVTANVFARVIIVEGYLIGDAYASEQIIIHKTGNVRGNLTASRVSVEDGAVVKGTIDMESKTVEKYTKQGEEKPQTHNSHKKDVITVAGAIQSGVEKSQSTQEFYMNEFSFGNATSTKKEKKNHSENS